MFHIKEIFVVAALLLVSCVSADQSAECKNCVADSMLNGLEQYEAHRKCWYDADHRVLIDAKIYTLEALVEYLVNALNDNNNLTEDKCKIAGVYRADSCDIADEDAKVTCLLKSTRQLIEAVRTQEQCHGEGFNTRKMRVASRTMEANYHGWKNVHPEC